MPAVRGVDGRRRLTVYRLSLKIFIVKYVNNDGELAEDADGLLYDPQVRSAMGLFAADGDTLRLEAAAAARSAQRAVERLRGQGAGGRGLSAGALDVLVRLHSAGEPGASLGDLARAAGMTPRNATGLVDTLERDGLVRRDPAPDDRRSVLARITPAGVAWLDDFRAPTQRAMAAVFHGFTDAELDQLRHLCLRLVRNQQRLEAYLSAAPEGTDTA
ncbi:MarR family winged helix-turn-helix transcriptional regulator [Yinghuangia seranimata]|uniref:MarR family winged helix-turn-helix transcriptional regulator n=1 Tax=Yinghuangia seranimata TaxID=408067 RepID=UPI00248C9297|nr:MarR family transcriptional regulator [Yinghuangia seranimata]MDI2125433.1 MarR family transcriptional regulator [Yinghuangia seranimata]